MLCLRELKQFASEKEKLSVILPQKRLSHDRYIGNLNHSTLKSALYVHLFVYEATTTTGKAVILPWVQVYMIWMYTLSIYITSHRYNITVTSLDQKQMCT